MEEDKRKPVSVVVGVDFGTARSGFAFSWLNDTSDTINSKSNYPGSTSEYRKTLTEIIYNNETKSPEGIGYEARKKYYSLKRDSEKKYTLFSDFKMALHLHTSLKYSDGVEVDASDIVSDYLEYLVALVKIEVARNIGKEDISIDQIRWCLTIPAIWNDTDKFIMRTAAYRAGMISRVDETSDRFLFALEPEAAGLYSYLTLKKFEKIPELKMNEFEKFMIIDAGGGTLDLTTHQILKDGFLKELSAGTGGPYGSKFVRNYTGDEAFDEFERVHPKYFEIMRRNCIQVKEQFTSDDIGENVEIPKKFISILKKYKPELAEEIDDDIGIELTCENIHEIFKNTLEDCEIVISKFFSQLEKKNILIDKILLVGGFGSSKLFQNHIKKKFGNKVKSIIIPPDPSAAVLFGSVYYGKNKQLIKSRIMRRTYGVGGFAYFDPKKHKIEKRIPLDQSEKIYLCRDLFDIWIRAGDEVENEKKITKKYPVVSSTQTVMTFTVYSTKNNNPRYIDEFDDIQKDLSFSVKLPILKNGTHTSVKLEITVGSTDVQIDAITDDGQKYQKKFLLEDHLKNKK
eukprot:gene6729-10894_t